MFRIEKRLTSFFRKNSLHGAQLKSWTLHKTYGTRADAEQAYESLVAKSRVSVNWRIVSGDTVFKQKNK